MNSKFRFRFGYKKFHKITHFSNLKSKFTIWWNFATLLGSQFIKNLGFMTTHTTFVNEIICDIHDYMRLHDCVIKSNLWLLPCAIVSHGCNVSTICDCKYVQLLMTMVDHDSSCKCLSSTKIIIIMNCPNLIMAFGRGLFQTCVMPTHGNL